VEICAGCGGRNPAELDVCSFCHRRIVAPSTGSRLLRPTLAGLLLVAVLVSMALLVLTRWSALS
jgi:hypothetical protein